MTRNIPPFSTQNLSRISALSCMVALLMVAGSLAGLFMSSAIYRTEELRHLFITNDVVNLFLGLPILLGSMWLGRRGSLIGLFFWSGALFYITYNYFTYTVAMPFTWPFVLFLTLVVLSVYTTVGLLSSLDMAGIQRQLKGKVYERFTGGALVGFALLIVLLAASEIIGTLSGPSEFSWPQLSVHIADLLFAPAWLAGGLLLLRRREIGYVTAAGLLFQASMLFIGLLVFFILQPILAAVPFPVEDFVMVAVMGLICFIPFGLFMRGVLLR